MRAQYAKDKHGNDHQADRARRNVDPPVADELDPDEDENETKAVLKQIEHIDHVLDNEEHGPQAVHGKDTGTEGDEGVRDLRHLGGDAVQSEDDVRELQAEDHHDKNGELEPPLLVIHDASTSLLVILVPQARAKAALQHPDEKGVLHIGVIVAPSGGLDAAPNKEQAKGPTNPRGEAQESRHHHEEDQAHDDRAEDAQEHRLVNLVLRCLVGAEDQVEDEEVIH
mmetsp:Transcript_62347/g.134101  ORF Transcript_62347/g.134101 Transcript_62347/m.134101 type:complete len:225 (+) Transcript_62347:199-873(+)